VRGAPFLAREDRRLASGGKGDMWLSFRAVVPSPGEITSAVSPTPQARRAAGGGHRKREQELLDFLLVCT
jgi:hypothetical protein